MRKRLDGFVIETTVFEILARMRSFRAFQAFLEKRAARSWISSSPVRTFASFASAGLEKVTFGMGDAEFLRDEADSFGKSDVLDFLDETEDVTRGATSEAVIELPDGVYGERRRLLAMERTEAGEILRAGFLEFDIVSDDADDVRLLLDGVGEIAGVGHGSL